MLIFKYKFYLILTISILLVSCNKDSNKITKPKEIPSLNVLYNSAFKSYENGQPIDAIKLFQIVETRYSYTEWAERATIMIIYIYFEAAEYIKSLQYIDKYLKFYPSSKNIEYVKFIKALCFYEQIDVVSRDQTYAKVALKQFNEIIDEFPNSIYAEDSKYKIDLINEQLAGKEMYLARYYMKKSKWIPAIKRLKIILDIYSSTVFTTEALHRLVEIYYKLGNIKEAKKYAAILGYNFNDSDWYKKTYRIVKDKNYIIENKKQNRKLKDKIKKIFKFSK